MACSGGDRTHGGVCLQQHGRKYSLTDRAVHVQRLDAQPERVQDGRNAAKGTHQVHRIAACTQRDAPEIQVAAGPPALCSIAQAVSVQQASPNANDRAVFRVTAFAVALLAKRARASAGTAASRQANTAAAWRGRSEGARVPSRSVVMHGFNRLQYDRHTLAYVFCQHVCDAYSPVGMKIRADASQP